MPPLPRRAMEVVSDATTVWPVFLSPLCPAETVLMLYSAPPTVVTRPQVIYFILSISISSFPYAKISETILL